MRAAALAIQFESPKLNAVSVFRQGETFAERLDRAIQRSGKGPLMIEGKAVEVESSD